MVEHQNGKKVKILISDNGTEFVNNAFDDYLRKNGILRQLIHHNKMVLPSFSIEL